MKHWKFYSAKYLLTRIPGSGKVDFGSFEMHSYEELKDNPAYQTWCTGDNEANVPPNGESGLQMKQRVLEAFLEIKEDTVIVCHGGVIAAIMEYLFPEEYKTRYDWQPRNGYGYAIAFQEGTTASVRYTVLDDQKDNP